MRISAGLYFALVERSLDVMTVMMIETTRKMSTYPKPYGSGFNP
jgi:hypothetical protein